MTEKRYYAVDYDEEYYIFDSNVIRKGRVEEEAEYGYDVFADSMSSNEIVDLLNEQEQLILEQQILINTITDQKNEFHRGARENANRVGQLEDENNKLKEENKQLKEKISEQGVSLDFLMAENKQLGDVINENLKLKSENLELRDALKRWNDEPEY